MVGLSSEPGKSFFVDEASERVYTRYQNINSEVKLQPINKVGLMKISLSNIMFTLHDPITIPSQKYTFALAHRLRLYDKCFGSLIVKLIFEALGICWENPSFREEVEKIRKVGLHVGQVSREEVFTGQNIAGWYVIYPLVGLHFEEKRGKNRAIYPPYVPVFLFVGRQPEICLVSTILQDFILCIQNVYNKGPLVIVNLIRIALLSNKLATQIIHNLHFLPVIRGRWSRRLTEFGPELSLGQTN